MKPLTAAEVAAKHNASLPPKTHNSEGQLKSYVDRFVNLAEQAATLREDVSELGKEAKGNGFDVAALKKIAKEQRETAEKRQKRETLEGVIDTYKNALGMLD